MKTHAKLIFLPLFPLMIVFSGCRETSSRSTLPGYLESEWIYLSSPRAGYLKTLAVERGTPVTKGDSIFMIDGHSEQRQAAELESRLAAIDAKIVDAQKGQRIQEIAAIEAQIAESQAALNLARTEFNRSQRLYETGAIPQSEFDRNQSQFQQAKERFQVREQQLKLAHLGQREDFIASLEHERSAIREQLALARWNLDQCSRTAPVDAVVHDTLFEESEWVAPGSPVAILKPVDRMLAVFYVPTSRLAEAELGKTISIQLESRKDAIPAQIRFVSSDVEYTPPVIFSREQSASLVFRVEAEITSPDLSALHPGAPIQVDLNPKDRSEP